MQHCFCMSLPGTSINVCMQTAVYTHQCAGATSASVDVCECATSPSCLAPTALTDALLLPRALPVNTASPCPPPIPHRCLWW
jgi:hypothetical protein